VQIVCTMKKAKKKSKKNTDLNKHKNGNILGRGGFLETVLESLTHPFYVIDAKDYTIQMANSAARLGEITGVVTCHALTHKKNKPCSMRNHPCPLEMVKKTNKPVTVEHIHYDKDGNTRNVEVHGFPIFDNDGNIVQMIEYCLDITDRKQMEEDLRQHREHLEDLVQARTTELRKANEQLLKEIERRKRLEKELLSIAEHERQRIGQELHDSIGQQLTGIAFMMEVLGEKLAGKSLVEEITYAEKIKSHLGQAAEQTRNLAKGLHIIDLDRNGLISAIQELASNTEELFDVSCTLKHKNTFSINDVVIATNLYRIAQEAITNAIKHGNAKNIMIDLIAERGCLRLTVENDGLDFPAGVNCKDGMGLRIMRYRAEVINGALDVRKGDDGGTIVTCSLK
jgi:PAS domain S-box-containing protein